MSSFEVKSPLLLFESLSKINVLLSKLAWIFRFFKRLKYGDFDIESGRFEFQKSKDIEITMIMCQIMIRHNSLLSTINSQILQSQGKLKWKRPLLRSNHPYYTSKVFRNSMFCYQKLREYFGSSNVWNMVILISKVDVLNFRSQKTLE